MATYTSTTSGNWSDAATWGGAGVPGNADNFSIAAGTTVTYDLTTPPIDGFATNSNCLPGGTLIMAANSRMRMNGSFTSTGNFDMSAGNTVIWLKGITSNDYRFDLRTATLTTTATGTSGQNTIVVSSAANLRVGMKVSGTGIGSNARITNIAGTTVTLSVNNSGTVSGTRTYGNTVNIVGAEGSPITTLTAAVGSGQFQQGFFSVDSAADFVVGDWIAVFKRDYTNADSDRNDEGYLIHDKDTNDIYVREFVGPSTTIQELMAPNIIRVANAKIFRTWQRLIFGTGADRNVLGITAIDTVNNWIYLSDNVTGTVVGVTVYTTGPLKAKNIGDKCRKCATTVATQATTTATTITLASVAGLAVGDEVLIDSLWPDNSSYTDERPEKRNITNISGNVITLNQSLGYIAYVGAFCVRSTRETKVMSDYEVTLTLSSAQTLTAGTVLTQAYSGASGVVKTTTSSSTTVVIQEVFGQWITGTTNSPFISANGTPLATNVTATAVSISTTQGHHWFGFNLGIEFTANQLCQLTLRDVQVGTFSNTGDSQSRFWIRGFWSSPWDVNGGVAMEGVTYARPNQTDNFNFSTGGITVRRYMQDFTARCCVAWNTIRAIWFQEGYNLPNGAAYNNYCARSETELIRWDHINSFNGALGNSHELAYNYLHRADDTALMVTTVRSPGRGIHHNWCNVAQGRPVTVEPTYNQAVLFQNRFERYFNPVFALSANEHNFIYNEFIDGNNPEDFATDNSFQTYNQSVTFTVSVVSLEHNYESDAVVVFIPNGKRTWNTAEQAWRTQFDDDNNIQSGLAQVFYVPPGVTISVQGSIKLVPGFNGTAPKLEIRDAVDRFLAGTSGPWIGGTPVQGHVANVNFAGNNTSTYQSQTVSLPAQPWGRTVTAGIINVAANASEGWYEKLLQVKYDSPPPAQALVTGTNSFGAQVSTGSNFTTPITRLSGGRLL
jgi:hypothetical protein